MSPPDILIIDEFQRFSSEGKMGRRGFVDQRKAKTSDNEMRAEVFDDKRTAKLGTEKKPAVVHVQTEERLKEVASIFEEKGWTYTIGLEPDKPEDITDLERLLNPPKPKIAGKKVGRNEPCLCGSGKKYKKCCGQ